jgi:endoribonuclease Dicer
MVEHFGCKDWIAPVTALESINGTEPQNISAVMIHGHVVAEGMGSSGRNAKVKACAGAVSKLESTPPFKFRKQYRCDCKVEEVKPDTRTKNFKEALDRVEMRRGSLASVASSSMDLHSAMS